MTDASCPDCAVPVGVEHRQGCDVARCLWNGGQRMTHELPRSTVAHLVGLEVHDFTPPSHDCGRDVWTGEWPGIEDCRRLGFWCQWFNLTTGQPEESGSITGDPHTFRPCGPADAFAIEDLNRLSPPTAWWDSEVRRWEATDA